MSGLEKLVTIGRDHRGPQEIAWAQNRPQAYRVPLPAVGDTVLWRSNDWFDPIPGRVVAVGIDPASPSLLLPEPWPTLQLLVQPDYHPSKRDVSGVVFAGSAKPRAYLVNCQEARLLGTAGWLPLDHENRFHPEPGV